MKILIYITLAMIFSGCGGVIKQIPMISKHTLKGNVVVLRNKNIIGMGVDYIVKLDGDNIAKIGTGKHLSMPLSIGTHEIGVKCFGGIFPVWHEDIIPVKIHNNTTTYLLISPSPICANIEKITSSAASIKLKTSKVLLLK